MKITILSSLLRFGGSADEGKAPIEDAAHRGPRAVATYGDQRDQVTSSNKNDKHGNLDHLINRKSPIYSHKIGSNKWEKFLEFFSSIVSNKQS
jgi:hypothetical protein